jgi:hypothetical protein
MVVTCPNPACKKRLTIGDALVGKRVSCRACKTAFTVTEQASEGVPSPQAASAEVHLGSEHFEYLPHTAASAQPNGSGQPPVPPGMPRPPEKHDVRAASNPPGGPPPLPRDPGAGRVPGGSGPLPPAPPTLMPPVPPPPGGSGSNINLVMNGLVRAMNASKIGYFTLTAIILLLVMAVVMAVVAGIEAVTRNGAIQLLALLVATVPCAGLTGVVAGGMAYLADMDERGRKAGIGSAFGFCARKFGSLFMGAVLFVVVVVGVLAVVNGLVLLLNRGGTLGSLLASLLFLPQLVINLGMVIALLVWVLVPVAIASEDVTATQAIGRLRTCLCRDAGRLFVHFAVSVVAAIVILLVLGALLGPALGITSLTNSSLSSMLTESPFESLMMGSGSGGGFSLGPSMLRGFFTLLVGFAVMGYLSAFWVGSFTGYYKDALRRGFRPQAPLPPPDGIMVTCPNPQCGKKLRVGVALAGKRVSCPSCKWPLTVPPLPGPPSPGVAVGALPAL